MAHVKATSKMLVDACRKSPEPVINERKLISIKQQEQKSEENHSTSDAPDYEQFTNEELGMFQYPAVIQVINKHLN